MLQSKSWNTSPLDILFYQSLPKKPIPLITLSQLADQDMRARTRSPDQIDEMVAAALALNARGATDVEREKAAHEFVDGLPMRDNSRLPRKAEAELVFSAKIAPHLHRLITIADDTLKHRRLSDPNAKRRHIFNVDVVKPAYRHSGGPLAWISEITKQGGIVW